MKRTLAACFLAVFAAHCSLPTAHCAELSFERIVIDGEFPSAYQVEVADVNGDKRPDVIAVGGGTCAWYENPTWRKRVVSTPEQTPAIISSATADLDGDGKAEIAIAYEFGMNEPTKGKLALARQGPAGAWSLAPVAEVGSIHRLRWCGLVNGRPALLVVAPIFGPAAAPPRYDQAPAKVRLYSADMAQEPARWSNSVVAERPVLHAIEVHDRIDGISGSPVFLTADNLGVGLVARDVLARPLRWDAMTLVPGAPGDAPKRGSSEVHLGRLADGRRFLATIDPWHGSEVAVCMADAVKPLNEAGTTGASFVRFGPRSVIDSTLADGHALWVADVDGDGDDEIFAGHRGKDQRVSVYDRNGETWTRTIIDHDIAAQDLRGGDLDADGRPDVVAAGGRTHNVVWYRPRRDQAGHDR